MTRFAVLSEAEYSVYLLTFEYNTDVFSDSSVTNYFLVNLSFADLLVTLICMPMAVGTNVSKLWIYGEVMCMLTTYFQDDALALIAAVSLWQQTYRCGS
ncbi:Orexin receptor type 1 [Frankliniella fusca]|uniref:Orexin receptor type 1 n=1 Tax=Frankliniella fusca TaxID=407009 RepID=A0AAE1HF53_9NEOP|nr:Orexin receptor type 1 [Frankliniella fusca]